MKKGEFSEIREENKKKFHQKYNFKNFYENHVFFYFFKIKEENFANLSLNFFFFFAKQSFFDKFYLLFFNTHFSKSSIFFFVLIFLSFLTVFLRQNIWSWEEFTNVSDYSFFTAVNLPKFCRFVQIICKKTFFALFQIRKEKE